MKRTKIMISLLLSMALVSTVIPSKVLSEEKNNNNEEMVEYVSKENKAIKVPGKSEVAEVKTNFEEKVNLTYIKNQVLFRANENVPFDEVRNMVKEDNGKVVGYIDNLGQYQVEYPDSTLEDLEEKMDKLKKEEILTPESVSLNMTLGEDASLEEIYTPSDSWNQTKVTWNESIPYGNEWSVEAVKAISAWQYRSKMNKVNVGVLETGEFYDSDDLMIDVEKSDIDYNDEKTSCHANHVSGIIGATADNRIGVTGVSCNAKLYGFSGCGNEATLLKTLNDAIVNKNIKVFNYSIGFTYTEYPTKAEQETKKRDSNDVIGGALKKLITGDNNGGKYDFVITIAVGLSLMENGITI